MRSRLATLRDKKATPSAAAEAVGKRFVLSLCDGEVELPCGEVVIGRGDGCDLAVDDMLVSRRHARLLISRRTIFIEDLGSTNGVLVNESSISGPTPLDDGDRIIIGGQALVVRVRADGAPTLPPTAERSDPRQSERPTLPAPVEAHAPFPAVTSAAPSDCTDFEPTPHTDKQDLLTMARVADRMIALGRGDAAVRVLGDHLQAVLESAKQGQEVPSVMHDTVAIYGMKLAQISGSGAWGDIAIELHLLWRRVLPEKAVVFMEPMAHALDAGLLRRYQALLSELRGTLAPSEQAIAERILVLPRT